MNRNKFYAAVVIMALGLGGLWESSYYERGTLAYMGPGYYPFVLSILLIVLGVLVAIVPEAPDTTSHAEATPLKAYVRPWTGILGGSGLFLLLGVWGGLVPATFALMFVAGLGDRHNTVRECILLGVGAVVFVVLVFHYGMHIQFPLWRWG